MYPFIYPIIPMIPTINEKPPTLYSLLNAIVNYGNDNPVKINELAKNGRTTIFDFDYPLSSNINKEEFETLILNKFMMRRIGFDTLTAFKLQLNVKLNEIMPMYNMLFDSLKDWDLFDGELTEHNSIDNKNIDNTSTVVNNTNNTSDRRYSNTPQNRLNDIKNGSYVTDYNFDQDTSNSNANGNNKTTENNTLNETTKRTLADKVSAYKNFIESKQNIYSMIFKDLNVLFYGIV